MSDQGRLLAAFLVALALHAGTLTILALRSARHIQSLPGEQEITIDLAPAMKFAEALSPAEVSSPSNVAAEALPLEEAVEIGQEIAAPEPLETSQSVPPEEPVESVADVTPLETSTVSESEAAVVIAPPKEVVVATPLPEKRAPQSVSRTSPKKSERKPPPAQRDMAEQRAKPSSAHKGQAPSSPESATASADPNVFNRYAAQVASALRARLRYPDAARMQRISGVATIRFTMQRSGRIVSASLVRSTGHLILDQAALATAAAGTNLPAAPDEVPQQQLTFSVPLRFNLR